MEIRDLKKKCPECGNLIIINEVDGMGGNKTEETVVCPSLGCNHVFGPFFCDGRLVASFDGNTATNKTEYVESSKAKTPFDFR